MGETDNEDLTCAMAQRKRTASSPMTGWRGTPVAPSPSAQSRRAIVTPETGSLGVGIGALEVEGERPLLTVTPVAPRTPSSAPARPVSEPAKAASAPSAPAASVAAERIMIVRETQSRVTHALPEFPARPNILRKFGVSSRSNF